MKNKLLKIFFLQIVFIILIVSNVYALSPQSELVYEGIDVSAWQGYIDYAQVKESGIEIVYIRASEGNFVDDYLTYNYENAKANGLKIGFYHYLTATSVYEAEEQAEFFASAVEGKEFDCKLAMDYEEFNGVGYEEINQIALAFMQKLKQITGKDVIVYSDLYNTDNTFGNEVSNEGNLWIAYYENEFEFDSNSPWVTYVGIQYTDVGIVPGIYGNVDRDKFTSEILLNSTPIPEPTPIPTPTPEPEPTPDSNYIYYLIKRGDTLWGISRRYGVTIANLVYWNDIENPNLIYAGNTLIIYTNSSPNNYTTYTVQRGDCLWLIARRYGTTVRALVEYNNIKTPSLIYPGQVLKIY